jgi:hypothetical protein
MVYHMTKIAPPSNPPVGGDEPPKTNHALQDASLDLVREIAHHVFQTRDARWCSVSICPTATTHVVRFLVDADAFGFLLERNPRILDLIDRTSAVMETRCRDRGVFADGERGCRPGYSWRLVEAQFRAPGTIDLTQALSNLCEAFIPPPHLLDLEVNGRPIEWRCPLYAMALPVGDETVIGNLHYLPPPLHARQSVEPLILFQGVPVGPCAARYYQFNVIRGLKRLEVSEWLSDLNTELLARLG